MIRNHYESKYQALAMVVEEVVDLGLSRHLDELKFAITDAIISRVIEISADTVDVFQETIDERNKRKKKTCKKKISKKKLK
jgi:hypothetical protein